MAALISQRKSATVISLGSPTSEVAIVDSGREEEASGVGARRGDRSVDMVGRVGRGVWWASEGRPSIRSARRGGEVSLSHETERRTQTLIWVDSFDTGEEIKQWISTDAVFSLADAGGSAPGWQTADVRRPLPPKGLLTFTLPSLHPA